MPLVECVPNFSEGRDQSVLDALKAAIASVPGARLLDVSSDTSHNRSVFTLVGSPDAMAEAAFQTVKVARERIDLRRHKGEHPRMGATDVVPFIPVADCTMDDCVALAKKVGERIGRELEIPVFLYARAAQRPTRERLPDVRKGEFEGLREQIGTDPGKDPDFGPRKIHESAGATAVGARPFLVAYNIYLAGCDEAVAKAIAKKIRTSGGGLPALQAMGITVGGEPQVSMNLLDIDTTPMHVAYDAVEAEVRAAGGSIAWSEIVGLVPARAVTGSAEARFKLREPVRNHIIEEKVRQSEGQTVDGFLDAVAAATPAPGGGTVAAVAGAMAASLAAMVSGLTIGRKKYADVEPEFKAIQARALELRGTLMQLGRDDSAAYERVTAAYKLPKEDAVARNVAIQQALIEAMVVPMKTLEASLGVARCAARAASKGNSNAASDAGVAALLAGAAARGAAYNVRINAAMLVVKDQGTPMVQQAATLLAEVEKYVEMAKAAVEANIGA